MAEENKIKCPNCGQKINVEEVLFHQIQEGLREKREELELRERQLNQAVEERLAARMREREKSIKEEIRRKLASEQAERLKILEKELKEKSAEVVEFNKIQAELEQSKREKKELEARIKAQFEKQLNRELEEKLQKQRIELESEKDAKIQELQKKLADSEKLAKEMQRKQAQGSIQLQGEVQELAIEDWLQREFPLDEIKEIKKGQRGADCLQIINTRNRTNCGIICYESKTGQKFQESWLSKLREDMQRENANLGVLVTRAYPKGMENFGQRQGIWICSFEELKGLSHVLRESLIRISDVIASQENKGDKMQALYAYLTSNEFRLHIENILSVYNAMQEQIGKERRAFEKQWKEREKHVQTLINNTAQLVGSIRGIAGNEIPSLPSLELEEE